MNKKTVITMAVLGIYAMAQAGLNDGLVASYTFDGNATDSSGNGHHGTVSGATLTTDRFGNANSAYSFDGENDYIEVADSTDLRLSGTDFTLSVWINGTAWNSSYQSAMVVKRGTGSADGWFYSITGNGAGAEYAGYANYNISGGGDPYEKTTDTISLSTWHNVLMTYDVSESSATFYVDGAAVGSSTVDGTLITPNSATDVAMRIGADSSSASYFFNGAMDDIRIYDRALSTSEITELQAVPEPVSVALLGLASALGLFIRRRFLI